MIRLQLYPSEFMGLVAYFSDRITLIRLVELLDRSIYEQVLLEYWHTAGIPAKLPRWSGYTSRKRYAFKMPVSVARILHQEMQHGKLTMYAQAFLATLDKSLINENTDDVYATRF